VLQGIITLLKQASKNKNKQVKQSSIQQQEHDILRSVAVIIATADNTLNTAEAFELTTIKTYRYKNTPCTVSAHVSIAFEKPLLV